MFSHIYVGISYSMYNVYIFISFWINLRRELKKMMHHTIRELNHKNTKYKPLGYMNHEYHAEVWGLQCGCRGGVGGGVPYQSKRETS